MTDPIRILSIDPARTCGWAFGEVDGKRIGPSLFGAQRMAVRDQSIKEATANAGRWLRDMIRIHRPTHLLIEDYMNPAAQPNSDAALGLLIYGALIGVGSCFPALMYMPNVNTVRAFVCGKKSAGEPWMTKTQKRAATKQMVIDRLHLIKAMPRDVVNDNTADAICQWVYWAQRHGRATPEELHLFQN